MRYGTIPIAHATGGLRDTIEDYNPFADGELALHNLGLHAMDSTPHHTSLFQDAWYRGACMFGVPMPARWVALAAVLTELNGKHCKSNAGSTG